MNSIANTGRVRVGLIGYGAEFEMGRRHANYMAQTDVLETVAVADIDPRALRKAR